MIFFTVWPNKYQKWPRTRLKDTGFSKDKYTVRIHQFTQAKYSNCLPLVPRG